MGNTCTRTKSTAITKAQSTSSSNSTSDEPKEHVVKEQKRWMADEAQTILSKNKDTVDEFGEKFAELVAKFDNNSDSVVSREELRQGFADTGIDIEAKVFDKIFELFDADGDGTVNYQEFTVTMLFMLYHGSAADNVDLAFRLFDTNRSGGICRSEFNDMIISVIGTKLVNLLRIDQWRDAFEEHLEHEFSSESIRYWKRVEQIRTNGFTTKSDAEDLIETFVKPGSDLEINVRDQTKTNIIMQVSACGNKVPFSVFEESQNEVLRLMETDSFVRFRRKLRDEYDFASVVFQVLKDPEVMTLSEFRDWAARTPGVFTFLDDLRVEFHSWLTDPNKA